MRDFTLGRYKILLSELIKTKYKFITFAEFVLEPDKNGRTIILRHDVDKKPIRALRTAEIENDLRITGSYYFRVIKNKLAGRAIERIAKLGHEIGYHYDDLNAARGVAEKALDLFQNNLAKLRKLAPVKTACMHGSPLSRHDNRAIWKSRTYRDFGIIGEPYFDIDFNEVLYLTDTGRRWDGWRVSIRDKVVSSQESVVSREEEDRRWNTEGRGRRTEDRKQILDGRINKTKKQPRIHSTNDLIKAIRNDQLPEQIMLTIHPQRWTDEWLPWVYELVSQNVKNGVKYLLVRGQR